MSLDSLADHWSSAIQIYCPICKDHYLQSMSHTNFYFSFIHLSIVKILVCFFSLRRYMDFGLQSVALLPPPLLSN